MIELDEETLKKVQKIELELLLEFDRICRKNNIKYSITGGTLLGAVRHGGFIPWDDDADVSMLRVEYEKFVKVCDTELDKVGFIFKILIERMDIDGGMQSFEERTLFFKEKIRIIYLLSKVSLWIFSREMVSQMVGLKKDGIV